MKKIAFFLVVALALAFACTVPSWAVNRMLVLDGNGDCVGIEDSPSLAIEGSVTLEAWVYPLEIRGWHQIIVKGDNAFCEEPYYLRMERNPEVTIEFGFWEPEVPDSMEFVESKIKVQVIMGKWNHIAGVLDVENQTMNLYLNGELLASKETEWSTGTGRAMPLNIGAMTDGSQFFIGFRRKMVGKHGLKLATSSSPDSNIYQSGVSALLMKTWVG